MEVPPHVETLPEIIGFAKTLDAIGPVVTPGGMLSVDTSKSNGTRKIIGR